MAAPDGPEWFAPKRYGFGAGLPIAWQGWSILVAYIAAALAAAILLHRKPLVLAAIVGTLSVILVLIAARTTRGGWHWRWGKREE